MKLILLTSLLVTFAAAQFNDKLSKICDRCTEQECAQPLGCSAGIVKDSCDCCRVCGRKEGQQCDIDVTNDQSGLFDRATYTPIYGRCGSELHCLLTKDQEMSGKPTDNAFCHCTDLRPVCGDNKRTYSNKCQLFEETSGRRETVQIVRYEPCDEAPVIRTPPRNIEEAEGADVTLSCEISGYPAPKIEWNFRKADGSVLVMPSDDLRKSVQARGGPEPHQVTGWLVLQRIKPEDEGTYTCLGKNQFGKVQATADIRITRSGAEL